MQYSNTQFTRFVAQVNFVFINSSLIISILYSFGFLYSLHACKGLKHIASIIKHIRLCTVLAVALCIALCLCVCVCVALVGLLHVYTDLLWLEVTDIINIAYSLN